MRPRLIVIGLSVLAMIALGAFAAGCGGDDETSDTATTESGEASSSEEAESEEAAEETSAQTTTPAGGGETLEIDMGEFFYKPDSVSAKAGAVTINAANVGDEPHELVLAKTDDAPADLPTSSDGTVDEAGLDVPGEIESIDGGVDGTVTLDLAPGKYVMFCNLPGHYTSGMYGSLTAK